MSSDFPIGRGRGIVKEWCRKENEGDRIGEVLNGKRTKQLERRKEKMLRMKFKIEQNRSRAE
jgi:hypothetical protein